MPRGKTGRIRKVIDIYENERKAEFIAIPVNIQ